MQVIVQTPREMPDWKASKFRRTRVQFEDEPFFVAEVSCGPDRRTRYVLEPWPSDLTDRPSRTIVYDAEYVEIRDQGRGSAWFGLLLWPFQVVASPVLGFLWSRSKRGLQARFGVDPYRANYQSLLCQYLAGLVLGVLTWVAAIHPSAVPIPGTTFEFFGLSIVVFLDAVMRYDRLQDHPDDLLGVGEWVVRASRGGR